MLQLKKYSPTTSSDIPCYHCALFMLCKNSINDDGTIKTQIRNQLINSLMFSNEKEQLDENLSLASKCKKSFPFCQVKNEKITQHILYSRGGREIARSNSFFGLIGQIFMTVIGAFIVFFIVALICCGIGSIF